MCVGSINTRQAPDLSPIRHSIFCLFQKISMNFFSMAYIAESRLQGQVINACRLW